MPIDRKYEKFLGGPTRPTQERIYVSLNRDCRIIFNHNVYRLLGKPEAVQLYFSRGDDMIALEPANPRMPLVFPVKRLTNGQSWLVQAAPFCKHFNIRMDTTERFISADIRHGALHLKLSETVTVRQHRRKKKD
ncbi:MAG: hypothetical protein ABI878_08715 [Acidobacteriota bacterium]